MPGPPPEHPHLRLLKGNPGKRAARSPPEPARTEQGPEPPEHLNSYAKEEWRAAPRAACPLTSLDVGPLADRMEVNIRVTSEPPPVDPLTEW